MKVWESPFIPSHLTFKKFRIHSISHNQSNNQSNLSIYYNIPKFRILGCYNTALRALFRLWSFVQIKSSPQLQLRVLRLCSTTRPECHGTAPSLIKLSSYIRNIQNAISVSCLFFVCSQEIDLRGQVDCAPAWSITSRSWFSDC